MDEIKGRVKRVHYNDGGTGASLKLSPGGESDDFWDHTTKLYEPVGHQIASNVLLITYMKKKIAQKVKTDEILKACARFL